MINFTKRKTLTFHHLRSIADRNLRNIVLCRHSFREWGNQTSTWWLGTEGTRPGHGTRRMQLGLSVTRIATASTRKYKNYAITIVCVTSIQNYYWQNFFSIFLVFFVIVNIYLYFFARQNYIIKHIFQRYRLDSTNGLGSMAIKIEKYKN